MTDVQEAKEALDGYVKEKMAKYGATDEKEMFGKLDIMEKSEYLKKIEDHLTALDEECDKTLASARSGRRKMKKNIIESQRAKEKAFDILCKHFDIQVGYHRMCGHWVFLESSDENSPQQSDLTKEEAEIIKKAKEELGL